jgi:hypothetical protein
VPHQPRTPFLTPIFEGYLRRLDAEGICSPAHALATATLAMAAKLDETGSVKAASSHFGHAKTPIFPSVEPVSNTNGGSSDRAGSFVLFPEPIATYRLRFKKRAAAFTPFSLPTGNPVGQRPSPTTAGPPAASPTSLPQAHAAMQSFLPDRPHCPPAGSGLPQTGLPPGGRKAPALPGVPGSIASNPIDTRGGLDYRGLTVDGNHAAGIANASGKTESRSHAVGKEPYG